MRRIKRQIFMGNGDASMREVKKLQKSIDRAISMLSGLQQGGALRGTPEYKKAIRDLEHAVLDLATGLGIKVKIKGELPYEETQ